MHPALRSLHLFVLALIVFAFLAACAPVPNPSSPVAPPTEPAAQPAQPPVPQELTVFAAASLTESFTEIGQQFEATHPGVTITMNFAGSQQLCAQLEQGARADVFASANTKEMNAAIASSIIISGTQRTFARNRLVVIYPRDNPGKVETLADLAKPGLKLIVADKAVPVGQYTLGMLDKMGKNPAYGADFPNKVLENVVSRENDVKAVVAKVRLDEADAGVVYSTDVTPAAAQDVTALVIPDEFNQVAVYPIAPLANAPQPDLAKEFIDFVLSDAGQKLLGSYGFILDR